MSKELHDLAKSQRI